MKWIAIIGGTLAVAALLVAVIGSRLPQAHAATRRAALSAPPEVVWRLLTDVASFPTWRSGLKSVVLLPPDDGRARWIEDGRSGRIAFIVERSEPPGRLVTRIADPSLPFGGSWTFQIDPASGGAEVTITENGEIYNPVFRFMARFVFGYEATLKTYLEDLQRAAGSVGR